MLDNHGAELADDLFADQHQAGGLFRLRQRVSPRHCLECAAHAKVEMEHHSTVPLPKEIKQVLAVHLDAVQRLLVDRLSACAKSVAVSWLVATDCDS